jgi:hypothetical protein
MIKGYDQFKEHECVDNEVKGYYYGNEKVKCQKITIDISE